MTPDQIQALDWTAVIDTAISRSGYTVAVKTNIGPEVTVYDSSAPDATSSGFLSGLVKTGVTVYDRNGRIIANYGGRPETNPLLAVAVISLIGVGGFVFMRGIIRKW